MGTIEQWAWEQSTGTLTLWPLVILIEPAAPLPSDDRHPDPTADEV